MNTVEFDNMGEFMDMVLDTAVLITLRVVAEHVDIHLENDDSLGPSLLCVVNSFRLEDYREQIKRLIEMELDETLMHRAKAKEN